MDARGALNREREAEEKERTHKTAAKDATNKIIKMLDTHPKGYKLKDFPKSYKTTYRKKWEPTVWFDENCEYPDDVFRGYYPISHQVTVIGFGDRARVLLRVIFTPPSSLPASTPPRAPTPCLRSNRNIGRKYHLITLTKMTS